MTSQPVTTTDTPARRRLLVITYHFPPDGAVGGLRWAGFAKYLGRLGWDVHIVTAAAPGAESSVEHVVRHTQSRGRTLNDVYNSAARRARGTATASQPPATASVTSPSSPESGQLPRSLKNRIVYEIRLAVGITLGFPDVGRGWIWRTGRTARDLLRHQRFDAVVTSGPPHSAHFAGRIATAFRSEPLFVDLRDPLYQRKERWAMPGITSAWARGVLAGLQRWLFAGVSSVIANTSKLAENMRKTWPGVGVVHMRNGIDLELLPARTAERLDGLSIAYVGTVYLNRSFTSLLAALQSLRQEKPDLAATLKLHVVGYMDPDDLARFKAQLAADGLTEMVQIYGTLPRAEALRVLARSDLALVLAQNQPTQIPAKLYECVGLGVPTLVVTETDSAAADEGRRIGAMIVDSEDVAGMRAILDEMVAGRLPATISSTVPISYESLAGQMDEILRSGGRRTTS